MWWIKYHHNGKPVRESSKSPNRSTAEKLLRKRLAEIQTDTFIDLSNRKVTIDELYQSLLEDYRANGRGYLKRLEQRWTKRIQQHFGGMKAIALTSDKLKRYASWCREQGLSNATINRDMSALRRAFSLAIEDGRLLRAPKFPRFEESEARQGFVEEVQYQRLAAASAGDLWLRALLATAYTFGFRRGELLNLRVQQVDLLERTIRLNPTDTKTRKGRVVVLTPDVCTLVEACVIGKKPDDLVFSRDDDGSPLGDFRKRWHTLTTKAGCPGLLFHDLRRSGVRNMVRRGVTESVAMKISGHRTRSVFERYNIVSESDIREAARKIEAGKIDFVRPANLGRVWAESEDNCETVQPNTPASNPIN